MAALSERKLGIIRTLVDAAPDSVVDGLHQALQTATGDGALASVRRLVDGEAKERQLRNLVFQPIAPMCVGDGRNPARLVFPAQVVRRLWCVLRTQAPDLVRAAEAVLADYRPGESSPESFDDLIRLAAAGLRADETEGFCEVMALCDEARANGGRDLLTCLDLAPLVRSVLHRLPEWSSPQGGDAAIGARVVYKDAAAISEDAETRFFQMLAAQLPHDWMIVRIISAVMDKPSERYLAGTDLGVFGEQILSDIDQALARIAALDFDGGPEGAIEAARLAAGIAQQGAELEGYITLARDQGWGAELIKHRKTLAGIAEAAFREADKAFEAALPTGRSRLKRGRSEAPVLNAPPGEAAVRRCLTLLTFAAELRSSSNYGGFAAARTKLLDKLSEQLDPYIEELLDLVKTGEAENEDNALAFLGLAADVVRLVRDDKAADLVRRRTATAAAARAEDAGELRRRAASA